MHVQQMVSNAKDAVAMARDGHRTSFKTPGASLAKKAIDSGAHGGTIGKAETS